MPCREMASDTPIDSATDLAPTNTRATESDAATLSEIDLAYVCDASAAIGELPIGLLPMGTYHHQQR
jgi:hypothetical protein